MPRLRALASALAASLVATAALALATAPALAAGGDAPVGPPPPALGGGMPFLWGVTLAGYQNDGGTPQMDWYAMETSGKVPDLAGVGPDFRHHQDEDLDRAKSLGLNAFRTSLEWARLEPEPGKYDKAEIAYAHHLLKGIRDRGMTPIITLHHFATPKWVYAQSDTPWSVGWENPAIVEAFARYVAFVAKEFGPEIDYYLTINEPSTMVLGGYTAGVLYPHRVGTLVPVIANIVKAHERAYEELHRYDPGCKVSIPDYNCLLPFGDGISWRPGEMMINMFGRETGWDGIARPRYMDYMAVHYYGTNKAMTSFPIRPYHWEGNPRHFGQTLQAYWDAFHLPILVAENGCATENHRPREDGWTPENYLVAHAAEMARLRQAGLPLMGYCYWTLTDSYEWGSYDPRFGLWSVELKAGDLTRHETPAAAVYREIVAHDGPTTALERRYPAPQTRLGAAGRMN